jgi:hypothetical protein
LDDYYTAMVVLANVVMRLACIVRWSSREGWSDVGAGVALHHTGCSEQDSRKAQSPSDVPRAVRNLKCVFVSFDS